jgi:hypothetical protein
MPLSRGLDEAEEPFDLKKSCHACAVTGKRTARTLVAGTARFDCVFFESAEYSLSTMA